MTKGDSHRRRSLRLAGFDYGREGAYFVTICTHNRAGLFGEIVNGEMRLNVVGQVAATCWLGIPAHFPHVRLDTYTIMPNHVHGIIWLGANPMAVSPSAPPVGAKNLSPLLPRASVVRSPSKTVGSIVRGFKIGVTKWVRANTDVWEVWQRNYYEHVIRNDAALNRLRQYIMDNPARWAEDPENPKRQSYKGGPA